MISVLRATALLATVAVLASAGPAPAQTGPADAAAPAAPEVAELASCADGIGGRWIAEKAGWRETNELRLVHAGSHGVRAAHVSRDGALCSRGDVRPHLVTDGEGGAIVVGDPDPNQSGSQAFALRDSAVRARTGGW